MTHDSAVRTVASLLPEIEKRGAENVLTDYAIRENLPAAQLEKLAQVFNTMRTVAHIEKAADRGSSVPLIDVPNLVVGYATHEPESVKTASPTVNLPSHDSASVDLMRALRLETMEPRLAKAASAPAPVDMKIRITTSDLDDACYELQADARLAMSKLASEIFSLLPRDEDGGMDISAAVTDARHTRDTVHVKAAAEWLQQASRSPLYIGDVEQPLSKRAFHVGTRAADLMEKFVDEFTTWTLMSKMAGSLNTVMPEEELNTSGLSQEDLDEIVNTYLDQAQTGGAKEEATETPKQPGSEEKPKQPGSEEKPKQPGAEEDPTKTQPGDNRFHAQDQKPTGKPKSDDEEGGGGGGKSSKNSTKNTDELSVREVLSGLGSAAWAPVSAAASAVNSAASGAASLLSDISGKERFNKAQQRTDLSVEDIRRAINVRRMIGTDPVLRESDPRDVLEIYNAIARQNPDIANNMTAVKLLLREAVQYEGLTLDTQKQLADIRKTTGEAESKEAENTRRRYSVGGAIVPAVVRGR